MTHTIKKRGGISMVGLMFKKKKVNTIHHINRFKKKSILINLDKAFLCKSSILDCKKENSIP